MDVQKTGSLIASVRKEQNRTQKDLANDLGVSNAAVLLSFICWSVPYRKNGKSHG